MSIDEMVQESGARADSIPAFVLELMRSLEERIAKLEGAAVPEKQPEPVHQ